MSENQKNLTRPYQKPALTEITLKPDQLFQVGCKVSKVKGNQGADKFCSNPQGACITTVGT